MYNVSKNKLNPFKTPDSYFSYLEKRIFFKIIMKKNRKISCKIPNNYFKNLEKNILSETVKRVNPKKTKIFTLSPKKIYWISTAACLFFIVLLGVYHINNHYTNYSLLLKIKNIENQDDKSFLNNINASTLLDSSTSHIDLSSSTNKISRKIIHISDKKMQKITEHTKEEIHKQEIITSSHVIYNLYLTNEETTNIYDEEFFKDNFILF